MSLRGAVAAIRLRRLVSFLKSHGLHDTAHSLERHTGVFFDVQHLRQMLLAGRWTDATSYVLGFIKIGDCSRQAHTLLLRILLLRVMADLAAGHSHPDLFRRLHDSLHTQPNCQRLKTILISMRSNRTRASRLYNRLKPMAVHVILDMVARCPELNGKARLPRCTLDHINILPLVPRLSGCSRQPKNKAICVPANILARSFMHKRPSLVIHDANHSGDTSSDEIPLVLNQGHLGAPLCGQGMDDSRLDDGHFHVNFEQEFNQNMCTKRLQGEFDELKDVSA